MWSFAGGIIAILIMMAIGGFLAIYFKVENIQIYQTYKILRGDNKMDKIK